jgi:hypothetical protein
VVSNDGIHLHQMSSDGTHTVLYLFSLEAIDQINSVVKPHPFALMNGGNPQSNRSVCFSRTGTTDQNQVVRSFHEGCRCQLPERSFFEC